MVSRAAVGGDLLAQLIRLAMIFCSIWMFCEVKFVRWKIKERKRCADGDERQLISSVTCDFKLRVFLTAVG